MELTHERLEVYRLYLDFAGVAGDLVAGMAERIAVLNHLDRASESIGVNLLHANAQSSGSAQRISYLDISIASAHECAASLDVCLAKRAIDGGIHRTALCQLWRIRGMLLGLKRVAVNEVREDAVPYGTPRFPFSELNMYRLSLEGVRWTHDLVAALELKARMRRKLDISTTGTVLNIAEGHGRQSVADQNRFMKTAEEHALQTILALDLMVARREALPSQVVDGKSISTQVISMLHGWCAKNEKRGREPG